MKDDLLHRERPPYPYAETSKLLSVPVNALSATLQSLQRTGPLESAVFWYGERYEGHALVRAVITPAQTSARGNYEVSAAAMSAMVGVLDDEMKPLAQIHSHPGRWVEHSRYDDLMASSKKALSIVFPFYGHWSQRWPVGVGVHEWQRGYWHLLGDATAGRRIRLDQPSTILEMDFR